MARVAAVVVAGGRGERAGAEIPKQYRMIAGMPVLRHALAIFAAHSDIALVQPVVISTDDPRYSDIAAGLALLPPAAGGATRQASVRAGLDALAPHAPDLVLVHDAARPFLSPALI